MSRLNFASIDKAFELGSKNIIDTQEDIANLKKLLASTIPAKQQPPSDAKQPPIKEKIPIPEKTRLDDIVRVKFISKSIYSFRNPLK